MIALGAPAPSPSLRRFGRTVAILLAAALLATAAGFGWFLHVATRPGEPPPNADGIVALTGGVERVGTALRLLTDGRARLLLLTGIGGGADLSELAQAAGIDPAPPVARVTLGRQATTTVENAAEAAAWARQNGVHSIIVVTAGYHMPRALTELARAMPDVALYPAPVIPPRMQGRGGLRDLSILPFLAEEYGKWLMARVGLSALGPHHEPAAAAHGARISGRTPANAVKEPG